MIFWPDSMIFFEEKEHAYDAYFGRLASLNAGDHPNKKAVVLYTGFKVKQAACVFYSFI